MPEELLFINPRRRRRARNKSGQFVRAHNSRRRRYRRQRNPIAALAANPRRRRRRRNPMALAMNPRRRRSRRRNPIAMLPNPRRRRYRRMHARRRVRRHNPRGFSARGVMATLMPAATGAAGAVLLDVGLQYVPLPAEWQTGWRRSLVLGGGAFALGYVSRFIPGVSQRMSNLFTLGALTVTAYGLLRSLIVQNFPQIGLSGITDYGMSDLRLGYLNPAPMVTANGAGGMSAYMSATLPGNGTMGAYMRDSLDPVNSLSGLTNDGM